MASGRGAGSLLRPLWLGGLAAVLLVAAVLMPGAHAADRSADSAAFVRGFVERAGALAQDEAPLDATTLRPWRALVGESLDMGSIARFVVGPVWRDASEEERSTLTGLIESRIAELYARRARKERGAAFDVLGAQAIAPAEDLVSSRLTPADGAAQSIDWRVGWTQAGPRILDIVADGNSLAAAKRSECTAILQRNRGDVRALIQALELGLAGDGA
jgi:phospholipid transport system substrate-binding protein